MGLQSPHGTPLTHGRHFTQIVYPAADRRPHIISKNAQLGKTHWLVDSGATHSVIFDKGDKPLHSIITQPEGVANNVHGIFKTERKKLPSFTYKAERVPPLTGYILAPRAQQRRLRADGVLGMQSLQQHGAIMLLRQKRLLWNANSTDCGTEGKIKLRRHSQSGHLIATVSHDHHTLHLILDTGASKSIISSVSAQKIKSSRRARSMQLSGIHQTRTNNSYVKKLSIGFMPSQPDINAYFVVADLSNLRNQLNNGIDDPIDGILGFDFIERYCHAIDFARGILYLNNE